MNPTERRLKNKQIYYDFARDLLNISKENLTDILEKYIHRDIEWYGPNPYKEQTGFQAHHQEFWLPFIDAFPDIEKVPQVLLGGEDSEGREWISSTGYYRATFARDWHGIPHSGRPMFIRYGEWNRIEEGKIREVYTILDIIDVMRIAGIEVVYPWWGGRELDLGPATQDGLWIRDYSEKEAQATLDLVGAMGEGLLSYDFKDYKTMHQEEFWDVTRMIWAGPGGIGLTRGLKGFQNYHQFPWLKAYPDRFTHGEDYTMMPTFAEANYSVTGCWSSGESIVGTHTGGDLFGMAATGKPMKLRDFDWYRVENGRIVENWCMIDIIHLMEQMGIDIFSRMDKLLRTDLANTYGGR